MPEESVFRSEVDRLFRKLGVTGQAAAALMILFGILILMFPDLVGVLIGVYLVIVGTLQLIGNFEASRAGAAARPEVAVQDDPAGAGGARARPPAGP